MGVITEGNKVKGVKIEDHKGNISVIECDYIISTMPIKDLIPSLDCVVPQEVKAVASSLVYRDFMTVGLLLNKMDVSKNLKKKFFPDTWIYIHERSVKLGRVQIFNNWSPYLVNERDKVWIGLEYFVDEEDELWSMEDDKFIKFTIDELESIDMIKREAVIDATVLRVEKAYPAYFGSHNQLDTVIKYVDGFANLFLVGRNGMHKYNSQDHSMLTAMAAVDNIITVRIDKSNIWEINTDQEFNETKK